MSNRCRICEGKIQDYLSSKNMRSKDKEPFDYGLCGDCGSLSILRIPRNLQKYYENYYSFGPVELNSSPIKKKLRQFLLKGPYPLEKLSRSALNTSLDLAFHAIAKGRIDKNARILDIGSGSGQFVVDLVNLGFKNALGADPYINKDLNYPNGACVLKRNFHELEGTWDFIMLNHVFEHMDNPQEVLRGLKKLLSAKGKIMIRIPNIDSYAARKFRENWYGVQAPVHLVLPSVKAMEFMARSEGLKVTGILGENVLEFWAHSEAYALDVWDFDPKGMRTFFQEHSLRMFKTPSLFNRKKVKEWKKLNKQVLREPKQCEWLTYYLQEDEDIGKNLPPLQQVSKQKKKLRRDKSLVKA